MKNFARSLSLAVAVAGSCALTAPTSATVFTFNSDPFASTTALTMPGRQVIGGEDFISFDPTVDSFAFDAAAFGITSLVFATGVIGGIPTSGVNAIVLATFDNDGDTGHAVSRRYCRRSPRG